MAASVQSPLSRVFVALFVVLAPALGVGVNSWSATITVGTSADDSTTNGNCTLREAIAAANNDVATDACAAGSGADLIEFGGNYTITLTLGEIFVNTDVTLNSVTPMTVVIDGNGVNRAFVLNAAASQLALENLTVQNCVIASGTGGAVMVGNADASLSATNVTFDSNSASAGNGGAISSAGDLFLTNVTFTNSSAGQNGGAVYITGSTLIVTDGLFGTPPLVGSGNSATDNGGAIYLSTTDSLDQVVLTNVIFFDNSADASGAERGGGAIWADTPNAVSFVFAITNCQFLSNTATAGAGGAILATNDSRIAYDTDMLPFASGISKSNFQLNQAQGPATPDGSGGAIYNRGVMTIVACSFIQNESTASAGGAIAHNPGTDLALTVANTTFNQNTADTDGGALASLSATSGTVGLINCTVDGNTATATGGTPGGGGLYSNNSTAAEFTVRNTIVSNNTSAGGPGNCAGDPITDSGNNVQWNPAAGCGTMTAGDPLLDAAAPDLVSPNPLVWVMALNDFSAAVGTGDEPTCDAGPIISLDARGLPRPQGAQPNCDAGAYEATAVPVELQTFTAE